METKKVNVFVTGFGVISPVGDNPESCFHALCNKQSGIAYPVYLDTTHKDSLPVGEVKYSNKELESLLCLSLNELSNYTRTSLLALFALRQAINHAKLDNGTLSNCAMVSGSSVGGMDKTENSHRNNSDIGFLYTHACGNGTARICNTLGIKGYRTTLSTACSSAANAVIHAAMLIKSGRADCVIAGGSDSLCRFTLNGFNSLMILDKEHCRPFDITRNGLNLGEGAAFLVLESEKSVIRRQANVICRLSGYANANDAFHQTASSPDGDGAFIAMQKAIKSAGIDRDAIGYINVHGTATPNNDLTEGLALRRIFGDNVPAFSSTKSMTGHALGAAAALEAVFSIMALTNNTLIPQRGFHNAIPETDLIPVTECRETDVSNVLSNSFGFGGNSSSLIFSK